jgi:hypothetical protein
MERNYCDCCKRDGLDGIRKVDVDGVDVHEGEEFGYVVSMFVCPACMNSCSPGSPCKIRHLHSKESFGPAGIKIIEQVEVK